MIAAPDEIGVSLPLIVAVAVTLATIVIHALAFIVTIHYVLRKQKLGQAARRFLRDVAIVAVATFIMLAAHLVEIAVWALVFVALGEFPALASALLPLGGELHLIGLRQCIHVAGMENAISARSRRWNADVRRIDRCDLRYSAASCPSPPFRFRAKFWQLCT